MPQSAQLTVKDVVDDSRFQSLPSEKRIKALDMTGDTDWTGLSPADKLKFVNSPRLKAPPSMVRATGKPTTPSGPATGAFGIPTDMGLRPPLTMGEKLRSFGREARTGLVENLPAVGAGLGAAAGELADPLGGGIPATILGGAAGTAVRDIARSRGYSNQPGPANTAEALLSAGRGGLEMGVADLGGQVVGRGLTAAFEGLDPSTKALFDRLNSRLFRSSETLATRGLGPSDKTFQQHLPIALSELKEAEKVLGPAKNVPQFLRATKRQFGVNSAGIDEIVAPQRNIVTPLTVGRRLRGAQLAAIPKDIKPAARDRLVNDIIERTPLRPKIGWLNQIRSETAATQSPFYGKDLSGQLTMEAGQRAVDIARGRASRELFYESLDKYGYGGGDAARTLNSRNGALIHFEDALRANANKSVATREPLPARVAYRVGQAMRPGKTLEGFAKGENRTVDQDLVTALRRWDKTPDPVSTKIEPPVTTVKGKAQELIPSGEGVLSRPKAGRTDLTTGNLTRARTVRPTEPLQPQPKGQLQFGQFSTPESTGQPGKSGTFFPGQPNKGQGQLFGLNQTRDITTAQDLRTQNYTVADLRRLLNDITTQLRKNPMHPNRQTMMQRAVAIQNEIRRQLTGAE
jgi:hypothetical protein